MLSARTDRGIRPGRIEESNRIESPIRDLRPARREFGTSKKNAMAALGAGKLASKLARMHAQAAQVGLRDGISSIDLALTKCAKSTGLRAFVNASLPALKFRNPSVSFAVRDADNGADPAITFGWADEQSLVDGIDGYEDGRLAVPNLGDEEVLQRLLAVAGDGGNSPDPSS